MTRELVLIHGRAQQNYDAEKLKTLWIDSLKKGLEKNSLTLPITEDKIHFPYYGNTLIGLVDGLSEAEVAEIIVRGDDTNSPETIFIRAAILETLKQHGVTDEKIQALSNDQINERGVENWGWVQAALQALDHYVPYASAAAVALRTQDVYRYLKNPTIRKFIDKGVSKAFNASAETVVVGHSLGAVVSYNVLHNYGEAGNWKVPLFVTVGAPLAVKAIKSALQPIKHPSCATKWFNAMDERDVVPLYPLDEAHFDVDPKIENKTDVDNFTDNRHGIAGYLSDPVVAKTIYDALVDGT